MKEKLGNLLIAHEHVACKDTQELFTQLQHELKKYKDLELYIDKAKEYNNSSPDSLSNQNSIENESGSTEEDCNAENLKLLEYLLKESHERIVILQENFKTNNTTDTDMIGKKIKVGDDIKLIKEVCKNKDTAKPITKKNKNGGNENPFVVILHDELCNSINESIMTRENVSTKKVYSESLKEVIHNLETLENADVFVIQALTHSLLHLTCDEFNTSLKEAITLALDKARKVVISLIVSRDDDHMIQTKAELINAVIKYNYRNRSDIVICSNENLKSRKFRVDDGLHLTPHGVSLLAVNLKQKIADSLDIVLARKPARSYERSVIGLENKSCKQRYRGYNVR